MIENHPAFAIISIWLVASAIFIGVPVALTFGAIYRQAKRAGVTNPSAVITRRFFFPASFDAVPDRDAWVECSKLGCTLKAPARITAVDGRTIVLEHASFEVRRSGRHAAIGTLTHDGSAGLALLILL